MIKPGFLKKGGRIAADASSLIYLSKMFLLTVYCRFQKVLITEEIYKELVLRPGNGCVRTDETDYEEFFAQKMIEIWNVAGNASDTAQTGKCSKKLSDADNSLIRLYRRACAEMVLTDDGMICTYCRNNMIPYINTPVALYSLMLGGVLTLQEFDGKLREVYRLGRYSRYVQAYMTRLREQHNYNV